ncbi:MAG: chromosome segregation protein SMC [Blautia sp.]|nr:chromosome segregation protein SMC [Blautia sp.]
MYLKNIEVHGFKSFAQKINFEFHNGITGIVGPNGSGKSNVADAVRWVLGEQSAKQLRGGNMQDVIFSGTELRKPLSYASVAITLDNADHRLPIDYNEVTVTRRLYRSGESEYLINGSICRLKDINEMFYDTGIGKEGYSIIGQGQIDRILSSKPEDRRELFDEAVGIVKFKRRKNQALKKLAEEQQNMVRVTDILSELNRQLGPLERQSQAARIYLGKRDELRLLDVNLFLQESAYTAEQLRDLNDKHARSSEELSEARDQYDRTREEYDRIEQELEQLNASIDALREENKQDAIRKQELDGRIHVLQEQILAGAQTDEHYKSRLSAIAQDLEKRENEKDELEEEKAELTFHIRTIRKELKEQEIGLFNVQTEIEECSSSVEDSKTEIIELLNTRATTKGKAQRFDTLMEQIDIRKAEISKRILRLKGEEEEQKKELAEAEKRFEEVSRIIREKNEEAAGLEQKIRAVQDELKKQNEKMEIGQRAYHREASRLESLKNITERYDGYGSAIRRVMEQKKKYPGIKGVVADLVQVDKDYEIAIETALGGNIQNIVTDTDETAKAMIAFLKKERAGRATFLPLGSIRARTEERIKDALREPGVIGMADTLVKTEPAYQELARYLLGRILVVDTIDHAIAIARKFRHSFRMVTLEGESLNPGGSMTGGAFRNNSNLLGRRREIEELESSVKALKSDMDAMQKAIDENREERNRMRDRVQELQDELRSHYVEQNTARMNREQLEEKGRELRDGYARIERDQEEVSRQMSEIREDHDKIQKELNASQKDEKELENYIEDRQNELDDLREQENSIQEALGKIRLEAQAQEQRLSFTEENLARIQSEMDVLKTENEELENSLSGSRKEAEQRKAEIETIRLAVQDFVRKEQEDKQKLDSMLEQKEQRNKSHRAFFEQRDELAGRIGLLDKEVFRLQSQITRIEENRESQINYLWEEYEITPANARQYLREDMPDRNAMRRQVSKLKEEIRALGPVNVNAIEEYKEQLERHTFLSGQYEDLKQAEATLQNVVSELDEGMRRQFAEKFADIQVEFDKAFKELFGGGKGTLELALDEENKDILEAGVRIIAQPPGKKLQNMMQLSGGEKALTAIALLFAIQNLKPSPFCLLDEIEAALDDPNVGRFASYLQKLTRNTQFIVITHRRGTMNAADRLYGITMQEKGVSTLVSVDLVENQLTQ